jgi:tetratricopeptide (TPR) repeat protein
MARRLNTRFLTILLLVLVGAVAAVLLAEKFLIRERPDRYIALGQQAMKDHNWEEAARNFTRAARLSLHDPATQMMLGGALAKMAEDDPRVGQLEVGAYTQALEINPNYLPALKALSDWYRTRAEQQPKSDLYRNAIDYTRRAYQADPKNEQMEALADKLVIDAWANGLDADQKEVDGAIKEIKDLWKKNPANGDLPYAIATEEIQLGMNLADQTPSPVQAKEVTEHFRNAVATFEAVLTGPHGGSQGQNAAMHFYFAQVLERLSGVDQSSPDVMQKDQDRASSEIAKAIELAKESDPEYLPIIQTAAEMAMRRNDPAGAMKIYEKMPDTPDVRLARSELMGRSPDTRQQALQLLKTTLGSLTDDPNHIGLGGLRFKVMLEMDNIQLSSYLSMTTSPEKTKLHDEIRASLDKLDQAAGFRVFLPLKEVEARFQIGSGSAEEMLAIQNLNKMMADNPPATRSRYWYVFQTLLAQGYEDTNQSANALEILKQVVQQYPRDVQTRKRLIHLLIEGQPDQVPPHLSALERLSPNDPELNVFRIQLLLRDPDTNRDKIKELYSGFGEKTARQISAKSRVALAMRDFNEASRLLALSTAQNPENVSDWIMLSELLYRLGKKDQALSAATRGLAANPKNPQLRVLIPTIQGEDEKKIEGLVKDIAEENPDKVQGQLMLATLAARRGDTAEVTTDLKKAQALAPDSPHVQELLFNHYLQTQQYSEASACIPALAKANADQAGGEMYRLALAMAQKDHATAEAIARKLTLDKPEFARSWLALGNVLEAEERYDQAAPQFLVSLQKEANLLDAYVGLVRCYYALRRPDDALHTIEDGLKYLPNNQTLRQLRVRHELDYGKPDAALRDIEEELRDRPDQPQLYVALADVVLRYVDMLYKNNQPDDAVKQSLEAVAVLKDKVVRWPNEPELYVALSRCQLAAKQPEEALKTLLDWASQPAWRAQPDPYLALSGFYEQTGVPDRSEDEMHDAMARSGYRADMQLRMASLLALHHKYDDALHLLRQVNTDNPDVREKVIQILLVQGKFDDAQKELTSTLSRNPVNAVQLLTLWSLALLERGQNQEAADRATQALAINPRQQTALFCRGRARLRMQPPDAAGALQDLEAVRQANPNRVDVRLYLADAHVLLSQPDEAASELLAALRIEPNNKDLRMKLVNLFSSGPHPRLLEALRLLQDVETVPPFDHDPEVFQNEAVIDSKLGNHDDALAKSEIAVRLAPDNPTVVRTNMQLLQGGHNYQAIVDHYAAMSDKLKTTSWALWNLALAEKRLGNDQTRADFKRALSAAVVEDQFIQLTSIVQSLDQELGYGEAVKDVSAVAKDSVSAQIALAELYDTHKDGSSALKTIDGIMKGFDKLRNRDKVIFLSSAAIMYQLAIPPQTDKAYEAYQRLLQFEPDNLEALNNLACLLADDYSPPRAQEGLQYINSAISKMSRLGRTEPRLLDTQAWLMILNGSPAEGVHILNTIMSSFPPFPDEYWHLGEGYLRMETPDAAQAEMQAKLGLRLVNKRNAGAQDAVVRAKLQDLVNRSEKMKLAPQAPVP